MDKKKPIYDNVKLPKNWGKIRIDGKLVNPTVKEILTVQGEDNQDYKIKKICPDCNKKYVEEPKPECDHIVGFLSNNQDGGAAPIHQSDSMAEVLEASELLKYCPECGEKLNLEKDE